MCDLPGTILIVDDSPEVVRYIQLFLSKNFTKITIDTAGSFHEARQKLACRRYNLVISDYLLDADQTGVDLYEQSSKQGDWVFMTANDKLVREGHPDIDIIPKPLCSKTLKESIHKRLLTNQVKRKAKSLFESMDIVGAMLTYA